MNENVSLIFATIICVFVLIIMPLFSLMSRQDSMSYNRVLNMVTTFVDSTREKGYFTEDEYVDFLTELSSTNNTYNVTLEKHSSLLIPDVNNKEAYVEDTEIYYNKDILNELSENNRVSFDENDEFYIKLYNTNITSASLLYSYFVSVKIAPKVINIGYGGKVTKNEISSATRTGFEANYAPVITFGKIYNKNNEEQKTCSDVLIGSQEKAICTQIFNLRDEDNSSIYIDFTLTNFEKIGDIVSGNFASNLEKIKGIIYKALMLNSTDVESCSLAVDSIVYGNNVLTGKVKLSDIKLNENIERATVSVSIDAAIGNGPTNISSSKAFSDEFVLFRKIDEPSIEIAGPFTKNELTTSITKDYYVGEKAYFRIIVTDILESNLNFKLIDVATGKEVTTDAVSIVYTKESINENLGVLIAWVEVSVNNNAMLNQATRTFKLQVKGKNNSVNTTITSISNDTIFKVKYPYSYSISYAYNSIDGTTIKNITAPDKFYYAIQIKKFDLANWKTSEITDTLLNKFKNEVLPTLSLQNKSADFTYSTSYSKYTINGDTLNLWYEVSVGTSSAYSILEKSDKILVSYNDEYSKNHTNDLISVNLTGIKIPSGFTIYTSSELPSTNFYIKNNSTNEIYVWVPYTGSDATDLVENKKTYLNNYNESANEYKDKYSTQEKKYSIEKYNGFYISYEAKKTNSYPQVSMQEYYVDYPSVNEYYLASNYVKKISTSYLITSDLYVSAAYNDNPNNNLPLGWIPYYAVRLYLESDNTNIYFQNIGTILSYYYYREIIYLK